MQEEFLHFIWRSKRYAHEGLFSTDGEPIRILDHGQYNRNAGPDFCEAKIRLDDTTWFGQVEMHLRASDWLRHAHHEDPAYNNVILHVVLEADVRITRADGGPLPCLELQKLIPARMLGRYKLLQQEQGWIPCAAQWPHPNDLILTGWLGRLLVERLEDKITRIEECLRSHQGDWEQTFYQQLARNFGFRVNAEPFEQLAERTPLRLLRKQADNLLQTEALLFGQAGMLEEIFKDEYPIKLQQEYRHLRRKYGLTPLPTVVWKFMRMRPNNFPTLRVAQFATLHFQGHALFNKMLAASGSKEIENMFELKLANYWKDHYRFDKTAPASGKRLGREAIRLITINTIAPVLFLYGREHGNASQEEQAIKLLEELPAEKNRIIKKWEGLGIDFQSAAQSQAALQWKKAYCDKKRCLECAIGAKVLA